VTAAPLRARPANRWFLLRELVRRDLRDRYAGSAFGLVWSFAQPLALLLLFTFVFSTVLRAGGDRRWPEVGFASWLFAGLLPWTAIQDGVLRAATAVTSQAGLVRQLRFPSELLVMSVVLSALVHEALALVAFAGVLVATQTLSPGGLPLLALAVLLQVALTIGLGLIAAACHVLVRDVAPGLGLGFLCWFYLTPIVYPLELAPPAWQAWATWNPLTALVALYRQAFFGGSLELPPGTAVLAAAAATTLAAGLYIFRRLRPTFADEV
jgi:lipopolysaccharide transport system permease protein